MPDFTNYDGRLEQMAYYCEQMLDNIAKVNNAYHDSVEKTYVAMLPEKLIKWKTINLIGGQTLVFNQLVDTGTTTVATISGHKYYTLINGTASIVTSDGTAITVVDDSADMVCDLTLMLGSGNEFATTDEFTEVFPAKHYAYNDGTLLSAGVTQVDVVGKNHVNTDSIISVASYAAKVDDYWKVGSIYLTNRYGNYTMQYSPIFRQQTLTMSFDLRIDPDESGSPNYFAYGFVKSDGTTVRNNELLPTSWTRKSVTITNNTNCKLYFSAGGNRSINIRNLQVEVGATATTFAPYRKVSYPIPAEIQALTGYGGSCPDNYNYIDYEAKMYVQEVGSRAYASGDESDATVITDGTNTQYKLDEPLEFDISDYLTDTDLDVEAGGSITFENQHGDDYKIPVPVELEYIGV